MGFGGARHKVLNFFKHNLGRDAEIPQHTGRNMWSNGMATCMYSSKVIPWSPNARRELCARQYNSSSELQSKHPLYALWVMQDAWKRSGMSREEINIILLNSNRFLISEKYEDMQKFCRRFELEKPKMVWHVSNYNFDNFDSYLINVLNKLQHTNYWSKKTLVAGDRVAPNINKSLFNYLKTKIQLLSKANFPCFQERNTKGLTKDQIRREELIRELAKLDARQGKSLRADNIPKRREKSIEELLSKCSKAEEQTFKVCKIPGIRSQSFIDARGIIEQILEVPKTQYGALKFDQQSRSWLLAIEAKQARRLLATDLESAKHNARLEPMTCEEIGSQQFKLFKYAEDIVKNPRIKSKAINTTFKNLKSSLVAKDAHGINQIFNLEENHFNTLFYAYFNRKRISCKVTGNKPVQNHRRKFEPGFFTREDYWALQRREAKKARTEGPGHTN